MLGCDVIAVVRLGDSQSCVVLLKEPQDCIANLRCAVTHTSSTAPAPTVVDHLQMLGGFIPGKPHTLTRCWEIRCPALPLRPTHEGFAGGGNLKGAPGKLDPVVVGHRSVDPIAQVCPVHDRHEADLRARTGPCVANIGPLVPVGQGNGVVVVETDGQRAVGCTLPAGDHPDT